MSIVADPIEIRLELEGAYLSGTAIVVTAGAIESTLSLEGSFSEASALVDPIEIKLTLEGRVQIDPSENNPSYMVEIRNSAGVLQWALPKKIEGLEWSFLRQGGCDMARFVLVDPPTNMGESALQGYDVRIKLDTGAGMKTWWRGYISDAQLILGNPYQMEVSASGYFRRLETDVVVGLGFPEENGGVRFENTDAAEIAQKLIDRAVAGGIPISYSNIPQSGFTLKSIQFNASIASALKTLAALAGDSEWGVDRWAKFYFEAQSDATGNAFAIERDLVSMRHSLNSGGIVNRLYLVGGESGTFLRIIENTTTLQADRSQTASDGTAAFGKATASQRLAQVLAAGEETLSAIDLKIGKTGWGSNLVTDGDMELADGSHSPNWLKLWDRSVRKKVGTLPFEGQQCLKVNHNQTGKGYYGVYQNIAVTANQEVQLTCYVKDPLREDPVTIELRDGTAALGTNSTLLDSTTQGRTRDVSWHRQTLSATPTTTTLGLRIYSTNRKNTGADPLFLDAVTLQEASDVRVSVCERTSAGPPAVFDEENPLAAAEITFEDIPTTPAVVQASLVAYPMDPAKTYGILIESQGTLDDTQYFLLSTQSTSSNLLVDNGAGWVAASGGAYHVTRLPPSQVTWGVRSAVERQPHITNDEDAALFGKSWLANREASQERGLVDLKPNRNLLIEEDIPMRQVRIFSARDEQGRSVDFSLRPERIAYRLAPEGLRANLELGAVLPRPARILAYLEYQIGLLSEP